MDKIEQEIKNQIDEEVTRQKEINQIIDTIEKKSQEDLSYLLQSERHTGESNFEYSIRRKLNDKFKKGIKFGWVNHLSRDKKGKGITYIKDGI